MDKQNKRHWVHQWLVEMCLRQDVQAHPTPCIVLGEKIKDCKDCRYNDEEEHRYRGG